MAALLGLSGVEVEAVEREADGSFTVRVVTAAGVVACCPGCGVSSGRVKEFAGQRLAHLVVVPMALAWHKRRLFCDNAACTQGSFVEGGPIAARGGRVAAAGRETVGRVIGDWMVAVSRVAGAAGVSWHTAHQGFVGVADAAGIVVTGPGDDPDVEDPDDGALTPAPDDAVIPTPDDAEPAGGTGAVAAKRAVTRRPGRSVSGPTPLVGVLGLDDHRRGRPRYHRDPTTGRWVPDADRWASVFVDSAGGHGLLGQVESRTAAATAAWIRAQPAGWADNVWAVTIDMSTVYKATARAALPHALLAVDPFHLIHLANKTIGDVRRRVTHSRYGRRGRAGDPEYQLRTLLVRAEENLSPAARGRLLCTLADLADAGRQLSAAWRAKEHLRDVLRLTPRRTGRPARRGAIADALSRFFSYCATVGEPPTRPRSA